MLEEESKKSNVRDVSCVAILSGRMTGVGGQSIAYVRKKQYLCIVFRNDLNTRKRDVRDGREMVAMKQRIQSVTTQRKEKYDSRSYYTHRYAERTA